MALFKPTIEKVQVWASKGNVKKLIEALSSSDAAVQRFAVEGLGKIGGRETLEYCRQNATNKDPKVRWHVTQILGLLGSPEAVKILSTVDDPTVALEKSLKEKYKDFRP